MPLFGRLSTYEQNAIMINNNNNNDLAIRFVNTAMSTVSSYVICHVIASPSNYPPRGRP